MNRPTFRRACYDDLQAIVCLLADDELGRRREDTSCPPNERYRRAFEAIQRDPNQFLAVAECDGAVVGCLQITLIPGLSRQGALRGQIESVRVAASQRGTGLGSAMIEWAVEECMRRGCSLVQLTTDKTRADARRFYEKLGFKATHEGMKRALRAPD